jgi:two-component system nitrogen regulation response regulator GlnG
VRELQSVLKQALLRSRGNLLMPEFLPELFIEPASTAVPAPAAGTTFEAFIRERLRAGTSNVYEEAHLELDRVLLPLVLQFAHGNQIESAKTLGIARQTLRNRLRKLGINIIRSVEPGDRSAN